MAGFGAGLAGLAFVPQGYDQGQLNLNRGLAAQNDNQGLAALGRALQDLYTPGGAPGGPPQGNPLINMLTGGGGGPGTPPASPMPGQPPSPGLSPPPTLPGATTIPPPSGPPVAPPGGPAPGMTPARPPGLASGGGPAAPPPAPPVQSLPGSPLPMGMLSWEELAKRIVKANPGASPEVIASAITKALPLMNAQSQAQWKQIEIELQRERIGIAREGLGLRERTAGGSANPTNQVFHEWRAQHPDATPEEMLEELRKVRGAGNANRPQSANSLMAQKWWDEHPDGTAEEFQEWWNTPSTQRAAKRAEDALVRQREHDEAVSGRSERTQEAIGTRQDKSIAAQGERQQRTQEAITGRANTAEAGRNARAAAREASKTQTGAANFKSVNEQIDSAVSDIEASQHGGTAVTGIQGRLNRWKEWGQGVIGEGGETRASVFETKIAALQAQVPRLLAGVGRISNDERAKIDAIVRGLGNFTDPQVAIDSLRELQKILRSKQPGSSGGAAPGAAGGVVPPASMLKEGTISTIRFPDGTVHQYTLQNGQPVEVGQ